MDSTNDASNSSMTGCKILSDGHAAAAADDDDDGEQYEVLENVQSDFLQHFENEIRISSLAGNEHSLETTPSTQVEHGKTTLPHSRRGSNEGPVLATRRTTSTSKGAADEANTLTVGDVEKNVILPASATSSALSRAVAAAVVQWPASKLALSARRMKAVHEPSLNMTFPAKIGSCELKIIKQPEDQHRARYLTEGSRGTVKDKSQQSHPTVKLSGYNQAVGLQVFVGTEAGRMKPHGFYQACKVSGKNSTPCVERDIEGTSVIEIILEPQNDMIAVIDCMGILKLRNADVEQRIGLAKSKKKSTSARLIFRVNIPKVDGTLQTLQIASTPITCTQPIGAPEISKKSISQCSPAGGEEMFIIGKNYMKGTTVVFEEIRNDRVIWTADAEIDQDFFQATHLVCRVPPYHPVDALPLRQPKEVQIVINSGGRTSEPVSFLYVPDASNISTDHKTKLEMQVTPTGTQFEQNARLVSTESDTKDGLEIDNSSLKRPHESSSSQEDLTFVTKAANVKEDTSQMKLELPAVPDLVTGPSVILGLTKIQQQLLEHIVNKNLVVNPSCQVAAAPSTMTDNKLMMSVPVQYHSSDSSTVDGNVEHIFDASSVITSVDLTKSATPQTINPMDFVNTLESTNPLLNETGLKLTSEPKQSASFASVADFDILMQVVGAGGDTNVKPSPSAVSDKMHWGPVNVSSVAAHLSIPDANQEMHSVIGNPVTKIEVDSAASLNQSNMLYDFQQQGLIFGAPFTVCGNFLVSTSQLSSSQIDAVPTQMNMEDVRVPDVTVGLQGMDTTAANQGNIGLIAMETAARLQDAMSMIGTASEHDPMMPQGHSPTPCPFVDMPNVANTHTVVSMDISCPPQVQSNTITLQTLDMISQELSGSMQSVPFADHSFALPPVENQFIDRTSEVGMDITVRQIAGMNLPETIKSSLNLTTSLATDKSHLQQSLAELIDLQQQVAASASVVPASPSTPPYRQSSLSHHDATTGGMVDQSTTDSNSQWSASGSKMAVMQTQWAQTQAFHDLQSPHSSTQCTEGCSDARCVDSHSQQEAPSNVGIQPSIGNIYSRQHEMMNRAEVISSPVATQSVFLMTPVNLAHEACDSDDAVVANWPTQVIPLSAYHSDEVPMLSSSHVSNVTALKHTGNITSFNDNVMEIVTQSGHSSDSIMQDFFSHCSNPSGLTASKAVVQPSSDVAGESVASGMYAAYMKSSQSQQHEVNVSTDTQSTTTSSSTVPVGTVDVVHLPQHVFTSLSNNAANTASYLLVTEIQPGNVVPGLQTLITSSGTGMNCSSGDTVLQASQTATTQDKVPVVLYELLTESAVQQTAGMTSSAVCQPKSTTSPEVLPQLSFDDINLILNSPPSSQS